MDILRTLQQLIKDVLDEKTDAAGNPLPPLLPTVLTGVKGQLGQLTELRLEPTGDGLESWLAKLRALTGNPQTRETLVVRLLQLRLPRVAEVLALADAITMTWDEQNSRPHSFAIDWKILERFTRSPGDQVLALLFRRAASLTDVKALQVLVLLLLSGPGELVNKEYEKKGFMSMPFGNGVNLDDLIGLINSPISVQPGPALAADPATLGSLVPGNTVVPRITIDAKDDPLRPLDGFMIEFVAKADVVRALRLRLWGTDWQLTGEAKGTGDVTGLITLRQGTPPDSIPKVDLSTAARSNDHLGITLGRATPGDALLFGDKSKTFLSIGKIEAGLTLSPLQRDPVFGFVLIIDNVKLGLASDILGIVSMGAKPPGSITTTASFRIPYLQGKGLPLEGGSLAVEFPVHLGISLGGTGAGLWIDDLLSRIELAVGEGRVLFRVLLRVSARAELGPLKATIDGAGAWLGRWSSGNAGLLPPTGIGLSLEAGPISGGGFIGSLGPDEYGGALNLKILGIGAFAYGIYKKLPDKTISFVALIGIRLPVPGIQIGFGFAVSGFGGLIGINRRADLDKLREKLASGSSGDVLFTSDPTRNAPKLLGDMRVLFPDEKGVYILGPTLQLNWVSLIKLDAGLFIELPGPRKIFIAGSGKVVVGSESFALVKLRLDFIGGIDLTQSLIFFEGVLVDSHILGFIKITGGLALRIGFGATPYFLFSVGGFHPSFDPGGLAIPQIPRAGAGFDLGIVWFRQSMYYAVTSNTVQLGARTEAGVRIAVIQVEGFIEYHALLQLRPFYFVASVDAGMSAKVFGKSFASIRVRGELSGPGPLVLHAKASVKILFTISKSVTITIDKSPGETPPAIKNLAAYIAPEIAKPANLRGEGNDPEVVLAPNLPASVVLPTGTVLWEQKRLPFETDVERVDGAPVTRQQLRITVELANSSVSAPGIHKEKDLFALASFRNVPEGLQLSMPQFSSERSGFALKLAEDVATSAGPVPCDVELNLVRLPQRARVTFSGLAAYSPGVLECLAEQIDGAVLKPQDARVSVSEATWDYGLSPAQGYAQGLTNGFVSAPSSTPVLTLEGVMR